MERLTFVDASEAIDPMAKSGVIKGGLVRTPRVELSLFARSASSRNSFGVAFPQ